MNTIYTLSAPNGKLSESEYTYDKSIETEMVLKVSNLIYYLVYIKFILVENKKVLKQDITTSHSQFNVENVLAIFH